MPIYTTFPDPRLESPQYAPVGRGRHCQRTFFTERPKGTPLRGWLFASPLLYLTMLRMTGKFAADDAVVGYGLR